MSKKIIRKKRSNTAQVEKYFRRYLEISPLGLSLWRAVEAKHLATADLKRPLLDVGCGFGEFGRAFFDEPIDMGLDIAALDLYGAALSGKYKNLILADARDIPFPKETFSTIVSISVFEHIPDPDLVLKEAYRVLKSNGRIVCTIETTKVQHGSAFRPLFQAIGLPGLSNLYEKKFNIFFHRRTLLAKEEWIQKIEKAGFVVEKSADIISPTITKLFDVFLLTSWPSQFLKSILGKRFVYRPKVISDLLVKLFLKFVVEQDKNGTNLFVIARKSKKKLSVR